ncbi:MAG: cytochrome P460 family protein [Pyrinomonadaceae bacterium]|nr:cytochrome P460 family protein [Pyrinomonadaceae bacterium]
METNKDTSQKSDENAVAKTDNDEQKKPFVNKSEHSSSTFGFVYANNLAKDEIKKETPIFPVGSIIVREKHLSETSQNPETIIAMVKREKGFSKETNDWEFFLFEGKDFLLKKRETKGDCAKCHSNAEKTDWVFKDYLK